MDEHELARKSLLINKWISEAYESRDFASAKTFIEGSFLLANKYPKWWDYDNIIHRGYTYLGLIAVEEGDALEAKKNLTLSTQIWTY